MPHFGAFFFSQKSIKVILSVKMVTVLVTKIYPLFYPILRGKNDN